MPEQESGPSLPTEYPRTNAFRRFFTNPAVLVALGSAFLYFMGALYQEAYYGRLGILDTDFEFSIEKVMSASFLPFLFPSFWLLMLSVLCLSLAHVAKEESTLKPFHPMPTPSVLAIVFWVWAIKLLADFISPPAEVTWIIWRRRDVILVSAGLLMVGSLYWKHVKSPDSPSMLSRNTKTLLSIIAISMVLSLWKMETGNGNWPFSKFETFTLGVGIVYTVYQAGRNILAWNKKRRTMPQPSGESLSSSRPTNLAASLFTTVATGLAVLLTAGMGGTVHAQETLNGCQNFKAVVFEPLPDQLESNHTYWLILHAENQYYVRDMAEKGNDTVILPEVEGMVVRVSNHGPIHQC